MKNWQRLVEEGQDIQFLMETHRQNTQILNSLYYSFISFVNHYL